MILYLVRHGDALSSNVDPKRSLSEKGIFDIQKIAKFLRDKKICVPKIFHSEKKRAKQTAEIIREIVNPDAVLISREYLLPDSPVEEMYNEIMNQKDDFMIVGHLPFLSELVRQLFGRQKEKGDVQFFAGTTIAFKIQDSGKWHLSWSISPREISS